VTILTIPAALAASSAVIYLLYIFAMLSRRLGAVTKLKPLYRGLYVAVVLVLVSLACEWIVLMLHAAPSAAPDWLLSGWLYLLGHTVPLLLAVMLALIIVLRYWGWLFRERER
jgi:hypothetical protein